VIDWLTFYNHRRLQSRLGYVSPMTSVQRWFAAQQQEGSPHNRQFREYGQEGQGQRTTCMVQLNAFKIAPPTHSQIRPYCRKAGGHNTLGGDP
jgi:hypothetical protein